MAGTLIFAGVAAGGTVVVTEALEGYSFERGDPGVYLAPGDTPIVYSEDNNTLRVDLGSVPVGSISISDVTVGTAYAGSTIPSGESDVVIVGGIASVGTYLEIGHLIIDRWRCNKMIFKDIEAHIMNVEYNASDGQSIAPVAGIPRNRGIGGGNRADSMTTAFGNYDLIKIRAPTSGKNGQVDVMRLSNIFTKGGTCTINRIKAGTIDIIFNEIGSGDGFDDKDFQIQDTVVVANFDSIGNTEVSISPP